MGHGIHFLSNGELISWSIVIFVGVIVFSKLALSQKNFGVPEGLQNIAEAIIEFLLNLFEPELGKELMPQLLPFFGTFFIFIFCSNFFLLIPFSQCPTGDLSTTAALAVISIVGIQLISLKLKGPKKYIYDWINPHPELTQREEGGEEGSKSFMKKVSGFLFFSFMKIIVILLIFLHVVDNGARLLSLTFRLFGNVFGEHFVYTMVSDVAMGTKALVVPMFIPFLILVLDVLVTIIQTVVFCMLSTFYLKEEAAIHGH